MSERVLIISEDLVEPWDEGIKKFTISVARALAREHEIYVVNVDRSGFKPRRKGSPPDALEPPIQTVRGSRTFFGPAVGSTVRSFEPDAIVYVPSPSSTISSFGRAFALKRHRPAARVGMVALIPRRHPPVLKPLLQGAAPDRVFVPSNASLLHLADLSIPGIALPVGVDTTTFRAADAGERSALRREFAVPEDAFVYLHIGHLRPKRNLAPLSRLARQPGAHVIVIGSTSTPEDARVRTDLEAAGVRVIREFVPVEKFYRLADCYVFPTIDVEGCVEIPLSVMEALASGLPVITRPFGGLRDFLAAGDDVRYFDTDDELVAHAEAFRAGARPVVRDMSPFEWPAIARRIMASLMNGTGAVSP
jgi:glycosyltransferase involved in cell wall biosynthesis